MLAVDASGVKLEASFFREGARLMDAHTGRLDLVTRYVCLKCGKSSTFDFTGEASLISRPCPHCGGVAIGGWNHAKPEGTLAVVEEVNLRFRSETQFTGVASAT